MEMMDRLVRLYDLPPRDQYQQELDHAHIVMRRPRAYEISQVLQFIESEFSQGWRDECSVAFHRFPVSCFIATHQGRVIGFAAYNATFKNFFGPIGVNHAFRGQSVGKALLLACLYAMADEGYAYAIIGGPKEAAPFYAQTVGALDIPNSNPGIYIDRLKGSDS